jgi:hypothetical protein
MKVRDSGFDPRLREFAVTREGIVLGDGFAGARSVLSGFAHEAGASDAQGESDAGSG